MVKVQKKDGSLQDFDASKISSGLVRVGLSAAEAADVASQIESWTGTTGTDGTITSAQIREKILSLLSPEMVKEYTSFETTKK